MGCMQVYSPPREPFPINPLGIARFFERYPHWTHEAFAQHVGIMPRSLRRILSGERRIGPKVREKIGRKFAQFFQQEKAA